MRLGGSATAEYSKVSHRRVLIQLQIAITLLSASAVRLNAVQK